MIHHRSQYIDPLLEFTKVDNKNFCEFAVILTGISLAEFSNKMLFSLISGPPQFEPRPFDWRRSRRSGTRYPAKEVSRTQNGHRITVLYSYSPHGCLIEIGGSVLRYSMPPKVAGPWNSEFKVSP